MTELILNLAALLLALFCLIDCVRRRDVYFPLPKGIAALLKSRRALFGAMPLVERGDDPRGEDRRFRGGMTWRWHFCCWRSSPPRPTTASG